MIGIPVVLVQRMGIEQRIKIDGVNPETAEVIQLVEHALQVAAVASIKHAVPIKVGTHLLLPVVARIPVRRPGRDAPGRPRADGRLQGIARRIVLGITVAKAVRKNLVKDSLGRPSRLADEIAAQANRGGGKSKAKKTNRAHAEPGVWVVEVLVPSACFRDSGRAAASPIDL